MKETFLELEEKINDSTTVIEDAKKNLVFHQNEVDSLKRFIDRHEKELDLFLKKQDELSEFHSNRWFLILDSEKDYDLDFYTKFKNSKASIKYIISNGEQIFLKLDMAVSYSKMRKTFPDFRIEKALGSDENCINYICRD